MKKLEPEYINLNQLSFSDPQPALQELPDGPLKDFVKRVIKVNKIESVKATIALSNSIVECMNTESQVDLLAKTSVDQIMPSKAELLLQEKLAII